MAQVDVSINNHNYRILCDDGQEEHLKELADLVDQRLVQLVNTVGQIGESRLLVMTCLVVADELMEAYAALQEKAGAVGENGTVADAALATATEALAQRIESIAARLGDG